MQLSALGALSVLLLAAAPEKAPAKGKAPAAAPKKEETYQPVAPYGGGVRSYDEMQRAAALMSADAGFDLTKADLSGLIEILSTSDGGFPFPKYKWTVPDLITYVDVPVVQYVNGLPVRFNAAVSKHDVPYLMQYYGKEFEKAGLYIPPPDAMANLGLGDRFFQVTGLDTNNLVSYSAMFQPMDDKTTTVIMAQGFLQEWLKKKHVPATDFAPIYPQGVQVVRTQTESMEMISFATASPFAQVLAFYDDVMPKGGYVKTGSGIYVRGQERIKVSGAKPRPDASTGVMVERRLMSPGSDPGAP